MLFSNYFFQPITEACGTGDARTARSQVNASYDAKIANFRASEGLLFE
jgi:hypothetical protein